MMLSVRRHALGLLWLFLMVATGVSFVSSETDRLSTKIVTLAIMLIAYLKARLVLLHFMGVRDAPVAWRVLLELWLVAVISEILIYALVG